MSLSVAIQGGVWGVTDGPNFFALADQHGTSIDGTTYLFVDKTGLSGHYQSVQEAIGHAGGATTILIAPGTYTESGSDGHGHDNLGLYINIPNLTLQGVNADGTPITSADDAKDHGPVIIPAHQEGFGANHWVDFGGDGTVFQGVHLQAGTETNNKLLEIWADNVTVENSFIDVNQGGTNYTFAAAIYLNDNGTTSSEINSYAITGNILNEGIIVANGVGDGAAHVPGANQQITGNHFEGIFDLGTGEGRYDTVVINGEVSGIGWLLEPSQTPTISGNTFDNNTTPFLLRGSDNDADNLPSATQIQHILDTNGDNDLHYAYVVDSGSGDLVTALRNDGSGDYHSFAVTNSVDTLNLALDSTPDNVFGGHREYIRDGDTVIVQSGDTGSVDSRIMVDNLIVKATAHSHDLNLTLATQYADLSTITDGIHNITLADYAVGQGADVDVTGNALANHIVGNSGDNVLNSGDGDDTLVGGAGADQLRGGADTDTASYASSSAGVTIDLVHGFGFGGDAQGDTLTSIEKVIGSSHDDVYIVPDPGAITEGVNGGIDEIRSDQSITLAGNFENLTLRGVSGWTGTGNGVANVIKGNSGDNILTGLAGNDRLAGGGGHDTAAYNQALNAGSFLYNFTGGHWTVSDATEGTDTLSSVGMVSYTGLGRFFLIGPDSDFTSTAAVVGSLEHQDKVVVEKSVAEGNTVVANVNIFGALDSSHSTITAFEDGAKFQIDGLGNLRFIAGPDFEHPSDVGHDNVYRVQFQTTDLSTGHIITQIYNVKVTDVVGHSVNGSGRGDTINGSHGPTGPQAVSGFATSENDLIRGKGGNDVVHGLGGDDTIYGGIGSDQLFGDAGNDALFGQPGNDRLDGGTGNDRMRGGIGIDTFLFDFGSGHDTVLDYVAGTDKIDLSGTGAHGFGGVQLVKDGADVDIHIGSDILTLDHTTIATINAHHGDFLFA